MNVKWIATLSDGATAVEHKGEYKIIPGERKPWVRLCRNLASEGKWITSLRVQIGKKTVHLPRIEGKFKTRPPKYYSLCYHMELDDIFGTPKEKHFIDLSAHYGDFAVHYIQDITEGNNAWVTVTDNDAVEPSPESK